MPPDLAPIVLFSAVGLVAYLVRGLTGAASAIVANALFLVLLGGIASGVVTLLDTLYWVAVLDVVAALAIGSAIRDQLGLGPLARRFLIGAVPVNVAFTLLLPRIDVAALGAGLGLAVMAAGAYLAARRSAPAIPVGRLRPWALGTGAASGVLGGLYGMGGPVGVLFFSRAETDPTRFRALITVVLGTTGVIRLAVLTLDGAYTTERIGWIVASLPAMAIGLVIGYRLHRRVSATRFRLFLGSLVAVSGLVGLVRTLLA